MAVCGGSGMMVPITEQADLNHDGNIDPREFGVQAATHGVPLPGGGAGMGGDGGDCADCVKVVQTTKKVQVPCTRNVYKTYKVKVPRQVTEVKPRTVNWVDMEDRQKPVTYTDYEMQSKIRYDKQSYQVPVQKPYTKMVPKTTKVPKTIYVDITKMVPTQAFRTEMQTRYRTVPVPYQVPVPVQKVKMETYKAPVNKSKVVYDKIQKTVYDTQIKTRCEPKTTMVTKTIPVFNVVPVPPKPVPQPGPMPGPGGRFPAPMPGYTKVSGDFNNDGMRDAAYISNAGGMGAMGGGGMSMGGGGMVSGGGGMSMGGGMPVPPPYAPPAMGYTKVSGDFNSDGKMDAVYMSNAGGMGGGGGGGYHPHPAPMPAPVPGPVMGGGMSGGMSGGGMVSGGSMSGGGMVSGGGVSGGMVSGGGMSGGGMHSSSGGGMHHSGSSGGGAMVPITAEADLNNDGTIDAREFKIAAQKAKRS